MADEIENGKEEYNLMYFDKNNEETIKNLIYCLNFATETYKDLKTTDFEKSPYINRAIGVAYILTKELDVSNIDLLRGCLLYATVEDANVDIEDITAKFGDYVGKLVAELTDDKKYPKEMRQEVMIIHARHFSTQAKLVRLADKLYNLRALEKSLPEGWSENQRQEDYRWALKVCAELQGVCPVIEGILEEFFMSKGFIHGIRKHNLACLPNWTKNDELKKLIAAANFAAKYHRSHFVFDGKNGEPYINHVISAAYILSKEAGIHDSTVLCATILYDVIGKGNAHMSEILATFGKNVANIISELICDHSDSFENQFDYKKSCVPFMNDKAKIILLATTVDKCRRLMDFDEEDSPEDWEEGLKESYLQWAEELICLLTKTDFVLGENLHNIFSIAKSVLIKQHF